MKAEDYVSHYLKLVDYNVVIYKHTGTNKISYIENFNLYGEKDAPDDLPSLISFTEKGYPLQMQWHKTGRLNRKNDLPSHIYYYPNSRQIDSETWYIDGIQKRIGNRPISRHFELGTSRVVLLEFQQYDIQSSIGHIPPYIWFNEDGTTEDEDGELISIDKTLLPKYFFDPPKYIRIAKPSQSKQPDLRF